MSSSRRGRIRSEHFVHDNVSATGTSQSSEYSEGASTSGESRVVRISLNSVREKLRRLAEVGDVQVSHLDSNLLSDFTDMKEVADISSNAGNSQIILRLINEYFGSYTSRNIVPGTVAAHFRGCTEGDNFGGPPACSAVCGGEFQPNMISGWQICSENVAHLREGKLNFVHTLEGSDQATLHVFDKEWNKITPSQLGEFMKRGIKKVALYRYGTGDYTVKQEHIPLTAIPGADISKSPNRRTMNPSEYEGTQNNTKQPQSPPRVPRTKKNEGQTQSYGWLLWILLILVLLALIYAYYRYRYAPSQ